MSGFGFSPSDIVKAAQLTRKTIKALSDDDEGAQQQYQQAVAALNLRYEAVIDLETSCAVTQCPADYSKPLSLERRMQQQPEQYEAALGSKVRKTRKKGIKRKLQYQFDGSAKVREHIDSTRPLVEGAALSNITVSHHRPEI